MVAFVSVACAQTRTALIKIDDLSLLMPENDMKALKKYDYIIPIEMSIDVDDYEECTLYTDGCGKWIIHADNRLILFSKEGVLFLLCLKKRQMRIMPLLSPLKCVIVMFLSV